MAVSIFDIFKIGIGPSSSHTVGPMRAAQSFVAKLDELGSLKKTCRIKTELFGSLGATGKGHGSPKAIILGLEGESPETVDVDSITNRIANIREQEKLTLPNKQIIKFIDAEDLILHRNKSLPYHANGMTFTATDENANVLLSTSYYSVGGGFIVDENAANADCLIEDNTELPFHFTTAKELLELADETGFSISKIMLENEKIWHQQEDIKNQLLEIWAVMDTSIERGCKTEGILPGGLKVKRRAQNLYRQLTNQADSANHDPLTAMDWVTLYALAVNEENAGGGRIVTAPTNGAAGIIPAVLKYFLTFCCNNAPEEKIVQFLLTAGAIGILYKENASISGAEVGCQGEVGSACSMAAGALAEVLGGTPEQVENAAEIAMEHNLGLTCDPIGGLVQVPCIERNAMAAIKSISAARMALRGDGKHFVSLDKVIKTMRDTGKDMQDKYKETARGGLAVNVIEVPVNIIEC